MVRMIRSKRAVILSALAVGSLVALTVSTVLRRRSRPWAGEPKEPTGPLQDLWTRVGGRRIYARMSRHPVPGGVPVVLVHGFGVSSSYMVPLAKRLAAEVPVFAPDLPGHGRSDNSEEPLGVPELAEVLRNWMNAAGLHRATFVANSMGCQIVAELAVRWPERVVGLVLIGPTAEAGKRTFRQQFPRLLKTGILAERPSLALLVAKDYARMGPRRLHAEMRKVFEDRIEDKLPRIEAPTLVVRGEKDALVPQEWTEKVARWVGADRVHVIAGAGHALNYTAADELMRIIRPFLREGGPG